MYVEYVFHVQPLIIYFHFIREIRSDRKIISIYESCGGYSPLIHEHMKYNEFIDAMYMHSNSYLLFCSIWCSILLTCLQNNFNSDFDQKDYFFETQVRHVAASLAHSSIQFIV